MQRTMEDFLATLSPMHGAKARKALEMQVRHNGGEFITRQKLVERKVAGGGIVTDGKYGRILQMPDGAFMDVRNITMTGLDYAAFLRQPIEA